MQKIIVIFCFCISLTHAFSQNIKIKGRCLDNTTQMASEMSGVSASLYKSDSTFVSGIVSDGKGLFQLVKITPGDYYLNISFMGYDPHYIALKNLTGDIDLGDIEMRESVTLLDEVTIKASNITQKTDRMVVLPTQSALKNTYNTYELLNNLNIPRLRVDPIGKCLKSDAGEVQIRINGIKATPTEVAAILSKDVIRIDVIENPGKRYGEEVLGAIVDIIIRKKEYGGAVNIQTTNSPHVLFGDNNLDIKFNHNKSQWGLNYNYSARQFKKMRKDVDETFYLGNETIHRVQEGINDITKFFDHDIDLSYNLHNPDKYTFNVIFRNKINDEPHNNQHAKLYNNTIDDNFIYARTQANSSSYSPALDIYYQLKLANNQSIQLNAVGTLINSKTHRNYREYTQQGNDLALIQMNVDGKKQSLIGEAIYDKQFEKVTLSAGMRHNQMYTKNEYTGTNSVISDMKQAISSAFVDFQGKVKDFGYSGTVGMTRSYFKEGNQNHTYLDFTPAIRLTYDLHKAGFISYRLSTSPRMPSLGSLTDVEQEIDTIQIVRGNPKLKPYYAMVNNLSYNYTYNKFTGMLNASYHYDDNCIMESLFVEDGKLVIMDENQKSLQLLRLSTYLALNGIDFGRLKNFLTLSIDFGYMKYWSYGNNYSHNYGNFFYDFGLILKYKEFSFIGQYSKSFNRLFGETIHKGENVTAFMLSYTKNRLQVGAGIMFPFTNNYRTGTERISSIAPNTSWTYAKEAGQLMFIRLNYNFEFGKKHRSGNKRINNSDFDSGIIKTNR